MIRSTLLLLVVLATTSSGGGVEVNFSPTEEWQVVEAHHVLPKGLHVKVDLQTGVKLAKLVAAGNSPPEEEMSAVAVATDGSVSLVNDREDDESSSSSSWWKKQQQQQQSRPDFGERDDLATMHGVLSALPPPELARMGSEGEALLASGPDGMSTEEWERVLRILWEKRQGELQDAMAAVVEPVDRMTERIATIDEILADWNARREESVNRMVSALESLEEYVADVDNARDFHTLGGWSRLSDALQKWRLPPASDETAAAAAWAIGTAIQNEPTFQEWLMHEAADGIVLLNELVTILRHPYDDALVAPSDQLRRKALYATAAGIRGNRKMQALFARGGGGEALQQVLNSPEGAASPALRGKAAALISDLLEERAAAAAGEEAEVDGDDGLMEALTAQALCSPLANSVQHIARCDGSADPQTMACRPSASAALEKTLKTMQLLLLDHDGRQRPCKGVDAAQWTALQQVEALLFQRLSQMPNGGPSALTGLRQPSLTVTGMETEDASEARLGAGLAAGDADYILHLLELIQAVVGLSGM